MNESCRASIIICTYNRAASLATTLESMLSMTPAPDVELEIVVVDNNSADETKETLESFGTQDFCLLSYVFEPRQGLSFARNAGLEKARGDIIIFTDDDVVVERNWLAEIVHAFAINAADCVGGKILPIWPCERPFWLTREIEGNIALLDYGDEPFVLEGEKKLIFGANMAFSRRILQQVGCFDTSLGRTGNKLYSHEDKELYLRVIQAGGKVIYHPGAVVHHVIGIHRTRKSYFRKWHFDDGEFQGIQLGSYDKRNLLGIPFYSFREFLVNSAKLLLNLLSLRRVNHFLQELNICNSLGFMSGRLKLYFSRPSRFDGVSG